MRQWLWLPETECGKGRVGVKAVVFERVKIFVTLKKTLVCLQQGQCRFEPFILEIIGGQVPPLEQLPFS